MTKQTRATLELVATMAIFGSLGWPVRLIPWPSSLIALARGVLGCAFLVLFCRLTGRKLTLPPDFRRRALLVAGGVCIGVNWMLLFEAYRRTSMATAELAYEMMPVYVTLAAPLVLHERIGPRKLTCLFLALFGMVLVSGVLEGPIEGVSTEGILLALGGATFYGTCVLINQFVEGVDALTQTTVQLGCAAVAVAPYALLTTDFTQLNLSAPTLGLVALVGLVHTGLAFGMWFDSMNSLPATKIALLGYVDPLVALTLSALVFGEFLTPLGMLGAALVLGSMLASELMDA